MRILISTSDKTGLLDFLKPLAHLKLELVSTGGTFKYLKDNNIPVTDVSQLTGFPEVLDGRVKTLHPFVHMGLLADKFNAKHVSQLAEHNVKAFDMVIGNLYPFEKTALNPESTFDDLIENIDIGGPSFLRASAKNFKSVIVMCSPEDYSWVQKKILDQTLNEDDQKKLAIKVFSLTAYYDSLIASKLCNNQDDMTYLNLPLKKKSILRYGENAQQKATWYTNPLAASNLDHAVIHQGKELSYNNLLDLDAAVNLVQSIEDSACVAVKHNNPCGVGMAVNINLAAQKAINADPKSIFGGIIAFNKIVDIETCKLFKDIFLECIIAPSFTAESLIFLSSKKNLRVLSYAALSGAGTSGESYKSVQGGVLAQQADTFNQNQWQYFGNKPTSSVFSDVLLGEKIAASLKSNAIAIVCNGQSVGLGMGQVNRVDAVEQAIKRMLESQQRLDFKTSDVVLASDAFFPFADSIELIAQNGISWIVQPGGSVQDDKVIECAVQNKINMILTQRRHFKH